MSGDSYQRKLPKGTYIVYNQFVHPINKNITTIGRNEKNDLVIQEESVSRQHAEIRYEDGRFILIDQESTNGTFVKHKRIKWHLLQPGTLFYLGDVALVFAYEDKKVTDSLEKDTGELKQP